MVNKDYIELEKDIALNCDALHLPEKIKQEALLTLKKYLNKKDLKGRPIDQYGGGLIFLACKKWNYPITAKNMNSVLDLDLRKGRFMIKGEIIIMRMAKIISRVIGEPISLVEINKYVETIQGQIHGSAEGLTNAYKIIDIIKENNIDIGHNNPALASAICYIANKMVGDKITEREYADAIGTTEISLRNYKRKILENLSIKKMGASYKWNIEPEVLYKEVI